MSRNNYMWAISEIQKKVDSLLQRKSNILIAIDGRCAAGKTTFADLLSKELSCDVVHMDDFFLRPEQRSVQRLQKPGENIDYERFLEEVLIPYETKAEIQYRPYDCRSQSLQPPKVIKKGHILLVEGAYSCHAELAARYDLRIFIDVEPALQIQRIIARNGARAADNFKNIWIPLEEMYFDSCKVKEQCDMVFTMES